MDQLTIEIDGRRVTCERGRTLFNILIDASCVIETACGGRGVCTMCRVTLTAERPPPLTPEEVTVLSAEDIARGVRLACRVVVEGPMRVVSSG
ncbi:MAG: 2Fe-2S iron-sulfur cluster binding domain-containing protein [Clostridia bacterium]|nr:2Fe-2S iron-sulfur cluster binding domain-containing protein [Deltaproteobacteria bacterium]